jgi:tetratricopeptide (TPR) repeat protein
MSRSTICFFAFTMFLLSTACHAQATAKPTDSPEGQKAVELFNQGKFVDAMPMFESLAADNPNDYRWKEGWAWCIMQYAATLSDPGQRKKARARSRSIAVQAQQLGDKSQLLQVMLAVPEDGSEAAFSDRKEVDEAMKAAEADFARGDYDKAREGYLRALLLDPNNYAAALFIGDVYFKQHVYGSAGEWFSRAAKIDPNRETAYRYWGDALVAMGKNDEARTRYIGAVVADPYNQRSWSGLQNWLQHNKVELNNIRLNDKAAVTDKDAKHINITLDSSVDKNDPSGPAWTAYAMERALWHGDKFKKEFPAEPSYRRTLKEEAESLHLMLAVLKEQKNYAKMLARLDPSLQTVIKIEETGLLEPFVLINRADADIAKDYDAYRNANRDKLERYFAEFVVPKTPVVATTK